MNEALGLNRRVWPNAASQPGSSDASVTKRYYELDLLRFIAALAVVLFHYAFRGYAADGLSPLPYPSLAPIAKYGFLGVDLFFLISGFVILMSAASGSKRQFTVSRVVRLYPAFWICCTATFVISLFIVPMRRVSLHEYLVNLTMLGGFIGVREVDSVYWSLFVEIQFYALVFLVLLIGQIKRVPMLLGIWLALYVASAIHPIKYVSFLLIPHYAPYFIAGATFFLISREGASFYKVAVLAVCYGLILHDGIRSVAAVSGHYHTPFSPVVVGAVLTGFFAIFFLISTGRTARFASKKWIAVGALTYPLYLIHQNVGFGLFNLGYPRLNAHLLMWGVVSAMLIAAYIVNRTERIIAVPMRDAFLHLLRKTPAPSHPPAVSSR